MKEYPTITMVKMATAFLSVDMNSMTNSQINKRLANDILGLLNKVEMEIENVYLEEKYQYELPSMRTPQESSDRH